jgi:hypothetical protein
MENEEMSSAICNASTWYFLSLPTDLPVALSFLPLIVTLVVPTFFFLTKGEMHFIALHAQGHG